MNVLIQETKKALSRTRQFGVKIALNLKEHRGRGRLTKDGRVTYPIRAAIGNAETGKFLEFNFGQITTPFLGVCVDHRVYVIEAFSSVLCHSLEFSWDYMAGDIDADETFLSLPIYRASLAVKKIGVSPSQFWRAIEWIDYHSINMACANYRKDF